MTLPLTPSEIDHVDEINGRFFVPNGEGSCGRKPIFWIRVESMVDIILGDIHERHPGTMEGLLERNGVPKCHNFPGRRKRQAKKPYPDIVIIVDFVVSPTHYSGCLLIICAA